MADPRVIVVAEPYDALGLSFCWYASHRGVSCAQVDLRAFAQELTLRIDATGCSVESPESALFVRPLSAPLICPASDDDRFHWAERLSALWSVGALSNFPVVNRPNAWGLGLRTSLSGALMEFRLLAHARAPEVFWHRVPPASASEMLHQDLSSGRLIPSGQLASQFVRSRSMPECLGWDTVIVVGTRAFRATCVDHSPYDLDADSVTLSTRLGLTFGAVSWGIPADRSDPVLAKVNSFPSADDVAPVWSDVREHLLDTLLSK